ncbi:TonB-dependent hemoglobin/transferrin/lactoferrin family receptor [Mesorhizobium qingshengii]|uniref:TonB-dependent hemoglobin/transferrin/lactoferrin family receptor n=1 Tax=Mesorhizobium qingshengii TaxID=1165689 RepID=A0ABT4R1D6_9HYPH|nr:TonB-dependent hemoglobin/transferrin/lactoferrin family receptor [Mesorhizobium qingshengii]MCZ8547668.1 TonB-dependent hemoglobin/transferrin/lactoferrin family receptor [Mesorhizobium qingshengii]
MGLVNWEWRGRSAANEIAALLASVAAIALSAPSAHAQQATQPAGKQTDQSKKADQEKAAPAGATLLDKILVLSRTGETAIESLASASHVGQEQLDRRMATTPNEMLLGVPGIAAQADARRVSTSINIRGLQDFGRVAIIVDGARQNFQRSDHGTQSTFYIDPELVKSVDVIRGPVANTYGSGAIGGVVFFDTKDAEDFLKPEETWGASVTGRYESNGKGWTTSASGAYRFNENWDVLGNIVYRNYDDYKDGGGDTVKGTGFDVLSGLLKTTIRPTDNSELKLGWVGSSDGWREISSGVPINDADLKSNTFTARYNITDEDKSWLDLHINTSYNKTNLDLTSLVPLNRFDPTTGDSIILPAGSTSTFDVGTAAIDIWNTSRFETGGVAHELTYGGDWVNDDVETGGTAGGDSFYTPSGKRNVSGAYVQDKLTWDWLEIIAGLRYDSYSLKDSTHETSGDRLSPRITVGVSPFESASLAGLQFYGTYAEGYRSPSLTETLISGNHPTGVTFPFLPNPNLRPETGKTVEFGVNYKQNDILEAGDALRIKAAYFNNDVDDYIEGASFGASFSDPTSACPVDWDQLMNNPGYIPICYQYQNFAKAKINGFELEGVYDAGWGYAGLSASITNGHTISYDGIRADLATIPSSQVTAQLGLRFLEDKLTVGGEVQYNGKPKGNAVARDYTLVNAFASYEATDNLKVDFRADNLFDVKYANPLNGSTTVAVYEPGITLKLAATMRFGG